MLSARGPRAASPRRARRTGRARRARRSPRRSRSSFPLRPTADRAETACRARFPSAQQLAADRVSLHATRVGSRLQLPVGLATDGADSVLLIRRPPLSTLAPFAKPVDRLLAGAILD